MESVVKSIFAFALGATLILPSQQSHPFEHLGSYAPSKDSSKEYFYSGDVQASWPKAAELCELFGMKLLTFDDGREEENFRKKFAAFFATRDSFAYIGANTTQAGSRTEWRWVSGEKLNFAVTWGNKQPDEASKAETCLSFDETDPLTYHDMVCGYVYPFICRESWIVKSVKVKE